MEEGRRAFKMLTGKSTGKRPLERPRRRWEGNIRIDLKEIGVDMRNWVNSAQDRNGIGEPFKCGIKPLGPISHGVSSKNTYCYFLFDTLLILPLYGLTTIE